jgi:hypothetical protein
MERTVEVRGLPALKIQTWATLICGGSDVGNQAVIELITCKVFENIKGGWGVLIK